MVYFTQPTTQGVDVMEGTFKRCSFTGLGIEGWGRIVCTVPSEVEARLRSCIGSRALGQVVDNGEYILTIANGFCWICIFQGDYLTVRADVDDLRLYPGGGAPFEDLISTLKTSYYLHELAVTSE